VGQEREAIACDVPSGSIVICHMNHPESGTAQGIEERRAMSLPV